MSKRKAEDDLPTVATVNMQPPSADPNMAINSDGLDNDTGALSAVASFQAIPKRTHRKHNLPFAPTVGPASRTRSRTLLMETKTSAMPDTNTALPSLPSVDGRETPPDLVQQHLSTGEADLNSGIAPTVTSNADGECNSAADDAVLSQCGGSDAIDPDTGNTSDETYSDTASEVSAGAVALPQTRSGAPELIRDIHEGKLSPWRQPSVWANTRSALGDSCPYYQARQGSAYHKSGKVFGMLIDGLGTDHDVFLPQVIITSLGGGRGKDPITKKLTLKKNRGNGDPAVTRFLAAKAGGDRIAMIVGDKNPLCPVKPPHPYCVLDLFHVTDVWPEVVIEDGERRFLWMLRFERVDLEAQDWWAPQGTQDQYLYQPGQYICKRLVCRACQSESKQIYIQGWTCLNSACDEHFRFDVDLGTDRPVYSETFLSERTAAREVDSQPKIIPALPTHAALGGVPTFGTESEMKKGVVCRECGCCSRRQCWKGWVCENPACDWTYSLDFRVYPIANVLLETDRMKAMNKKLVFDSAWLQRWTLASDGYDVEVFTFPDEDHNIVGVAAVLRATPEICSKPGGPDDLFRDLQKDDLHLRRNPARAAGSRIEELTSHFLSNWGAIYKFGVSVGSRGFDEAPPSILRSLSQLTWAQERVIQAVAEHMAAEDLGYNKESMTLRSETFNELLSLGYFESSHISYHDDGEKELGPTVATCSLGSPSIMRFQPKRKNRIGHKGNNRQGDKAPVLSFPIYHGDIVIMHGTLIHKLYNHEVQPFGKLRFALTSRFIRNDTIRDPVKRQESIEKGKIPEGIEKLAYKGVDPVSRSETAEIDDTTEAGITIEDAIAAHTDDRAETPANDHHVPPVESQLALTPTETFQSTWMQCKDQVETNPFLFTGMPEAQRQGLMGELLDMTQLLHASGSMPTP